jgi:hypothetical protein
MQAALTPIVIIRLTETSYSIVVYNWNMLTLKQGSIYMIMDSVHTFELACTCGGERERWVVGSGRVNR